jgi:O-methyltransferase
MMRALVRRLLRRGGYDLVRYPPPDFSAEDLALIREVGPYTLTTPERLFALIRATEHVVRHAVPGDMVECGVWRGGSIMAVARTLLRLGDQSRHLYLFDTFEGMPAPSDADVHFAGQSAAGMLAARPRSTEDGTWAYAPLEAVRAAVLRVGYDPGRIHFVAGKVEDTVPAQAPDRIALLRLDTDWYESTRHELAHLLPRLVSGGVLIIDDYGHWLGARKAVDEYFAEHGVDILLARVDYSARIGVKR